MLYHIVKKTDWEKYANSEAYFSPSFDQEQFIHLSLKHQLSGVMDRYYKGQIDLLQLSIDESKLGEALKYEASSTGELFPHLYAGLDKNAVIEVLPL